MRTIQLILILFVLSPIVYGQSNAVKTYAAKKEGQSDLSNASKENGSASINYFDGLGRPVQSVAKQTTPTGKDIITGIEYDVYGRQTINYLPYAAGSSNGAYRSNWKSELESFYQNTSNGVADEQTYFYSETLLEDSPLSRPQKQYGTGTAWRNQNKAVNYTYRSNSAAENIPFFSVSFNSDQISYTTSSGGNRFYGAGQLWVTETTDENGGMVAEFKDKLGQVVCKYVESVDVDDALTYYLYDERGQLRFVIQPEGMKQLGNNWGQLNTTAFREKWMFQYTYDGRGRMIEKQVPGAGKVIMIYDDRDRLVLTQDAEQRKTNSFSFTKYDHLNRPIMTGEKVINTAVATLRDMLNGADWLQNYAAFETRTGSLFGYTSNSLPKSITVDNVYTVTYYDDYDFLSGNGFQTGFTYSRPTTAGQSSPQGTYYYEASANSRVKGQVTGSIVRVLDDNDLIRSVTYYDERYRPIQVISRNEFQGTTERSSSLYNFPGWLLATRRSMEKDGNTFEIRQRFTYDHTGRLLKGYHQLLNNGQAQPEVLLAENKYNELGELIEKNLHVENGIPQQSVDYSYNIRGWLESINTPELLPEPDQIPNTDYFGMYLHYINENTPSIE